MSICINETGIEKAPILAGAVFNNQLWRQLIKEACHSIDINKEGFQIISPWGFEVTKDKKFLSKRLRRFYCYIGVPNIGNTNKTKLASEYASTIYDKIRHTDIELYEDIVLLVEHDSFRKLKSDTYICRPSDKLIDVQIRVIETDILTDYANYLICTLTGMLEGKGESKAMMENKVCRWRFYQLYIIQEQLHGYLLPPFTEEELKAYRSIFILTDNMIQVFYSPDSILGIPNPWEIYVIEFLIKKRLGLIRRAIMSSNKSKNITIRSVSYHIEEEMELTLNEEIYHDTVSHIKQSYLGFI